MSEQEELNFIREKIDNIDYLIHDLINDRAKLALKIAEIKVKYQGAQANFYQPEREKTILQQIKNYNKGPLDEFSIARIFSSIIQECRDLQINTCKEEKS